MKHFLVAALMISGSIALAADKPIQATQVSVTPNIVSCHISAFDNSEFIQAKLVKGVQFDADIFNKYANLPVADRMTIDNLPWTDAAAPSPEHPEAMKDVLDIDRMNANDTRVVQSFLSSVVDLCTQVELVK